MKKDIKLRSIDITSADTGNMMTRQRADNLKEIESLRLQIQALKYKNYMSLNYGVIAFVFLCSLVATHAQQNDGFNDMLTLNTDKLGFSLKLSDYNTLDRSFIITAYHYIIYNAITHRFFVSIFMGLTLLASGYGLIHV